METATFAGGCFWCMQPVFELLDGVSTSHAGYANGTGPSPTYHDYAAKGYVEAVQITYDPSRITYTKLLDVFWHQIDPTDAGGQFVNRGAAYRPAIFYHRHRAETCRGEVRPGTRHLGPLQEAHCNRDRPGHQFLQGRRLPPKLLLERPGPLRAVPRRVRPRPVSRTNWGKVDVDPHTEGQPFRVSHAQQARTQEAADPAPICRHPESRNGTALPE